MSDKTEESPPCIFCLIGAGTIKPAIVYEDDRVVAFLDRSPIRTGHTLIIPRAHHDYFDDLPADLASHIVAIGQKIAKAQKALYGVKRVGFMFTGTDLAHAHAHSVPMHSGMDLTSRQYIAEEKLTFRPIEPRGEEELAGTAAEIRSALDA